MTLTTFIEKHFNGNKSAFARSQDVTPQQVTPWIREGWIVVENTLYSPKRELNMGVQENLNKEAIDYLPTIKELIAKAEPFEANQMKCKAIHEMLSSSQPVASMNADELKCFQMRLVSTFKHNEWVD